MLLYFPLVYTASILPNSIVRFNDYRPGVETPFVWSSIAGCFMALGGLADVLLWVYTRPDLFGDSVDENEEDERSDDTSLPGRESIAKTPL